MRIVKQNRFKNLGELHKEWTEAGVKASRVTTHRRVKEFGYSCHQRRLTWATEKKNWTVAQWSKVLFSDESKFCISFGNQGPRVWSLVEKLIAQVAWSPVLSFHGLWWFGVQRHLLVLVHCVFWKPMSLHPFIKTFWSTSCFLLLTSFLKMLISFSSKIWHLPTLPKVPKLGLMTMVLVCLTSQQTHQTWTPERIYGVLSRGKLETRDQKMQMSWRPLSKKPGLPYHLSSATNWSPPCHAELRQ